MRMYSRSEVENIVREELLKRAGSSSGRVLCLRVVPPYGTTNMRRLASHLKGILRDGPGPDAVVFVPLPYVCIFSEELRYDRLAAGLCCSELRIHDDQDIYDISDLGCTAVLAEDGYELPAEAVVKFESCGIRMFRASDRDCLLVDIGAGDGDICRELLKKLSDPEVCLWL